MADKQTSDDRFEASRQLGFYLFPPIGAIVLLALLSLYSLQNIRRSEVHSNQAREAIGELNALLRELLNAETGHRGYLLVKDPAYLEPFYSSKPQIVTHVDELRHRVTDPTAIALIDESKTLCQQKVEEMTYSLGLARDGKDEEAAARVASGKGKELMDSIRLLLRRVELILRRNIIDSDRDAWTAYFQAITLASISILIALFAIVASLLRVERELQRRRASDSLVRQRASQLQSFADIASRVAAGRDIDSIIGIALNDFRQLIGAREALIQLKAGETFRVERGVMASGIQEPTQEYLSCIFQLVNALSHGETTFFRHRPDILRIDSVIATRAWTVCGDAMDSFLSAPLVDNSRQEIGRFVLLGKFDDNFNANDISIVSQLAYTLSVALENARLNEQARMAAQRKDEFLAMLGHELRNPLAGVLTGSEALLNYPATDNHRGADVKRLEEAIYRQSRMMQHIVDDLLDVSRIGQGKISLAKTDFDMLELTLNAVEDYQKSHSDRKISLESLVEEGSLVVHGDRVRITQCITNLIHNACKFSPTDSLITVRIKKESDNVQAVETVAVLVIDEGIGLDESELKSIFELFYQAGTTIDRSRGGLGIGLTLAKGLVEMHSGKLLVSSGGRGKGAIFTIRLPLIPSDEGDKRISESPKSESPVKNSTPANDMSAIRSLKILAIDDRIDAILPIRVLMTRDGHEVFEAGTGSDGLEKARMVLPDMILCDIGLPGDLNGYDVARAVRLEPKLSKTYLVALSGYSQPIDRQRSKLAGFDYHVSKPIDLATLRTLVTTQPKFQESLS